MNRGARVIYLPPAPSAARYAPLVLDWGRRDESAGGERRPRRDS